ncbi:MAG: methionine adenosyltransferase [Bdellovibrionaceae bacterium]|nr:methionine adenosyltransferase [Pseudobdellovibrionaceae bacterium]
METFFTSESVSEGHPDKLADQISDAVLDAFLSKDSSSHVACEVLLTNKKVMICGEVSSKAKVDTKKIAKNLIKKVGYDSLDKGLDYNSCLIESLLNSQSPNIKSAVGSGENQGAGDQGIMFGYATNETNQAMPLSIHIAHKLMENLAQLRKNGHNFLWPDSKSQVTVRYENNTLKDISDIVISTQHDPSFNLKDLEEFVKEELIKVSVPSEYLSSKTKIIVNPGGKFVVGGPKADCGLTGRKIIVDTYGGHGAHGGGAFSGKDPSKVDRSGAYMARHIAKNFVQAGVCDKCLIQISYAIGISEPISVWIEDFGTSSLDQKKLKQLVEKNWKLKPRAIIKDLDLLNRNYQSTACYGHFGREDENFTWEKTNKVSKLK